MHIVCSISDFLFKSWNIGHQLTALESHKPYLSPFKRKMLNRFNDLNKNCLEIQIVLCNELEYLLRIKK